MQPAQAMHDRQRRLSALLHEATILSRMHHLPLASAILDAEIARTRVALESASGAHPTGYPSDSRQALSAVVGSTLTDHSACAREIGSQFRLGPAATSRVVGAAGSTSNVGGHSHVVAHAQQLVTDSVPSGGSGNGNTGSGGGCLGVRKRIRLKVPAEKYPEYNFVGRLLGPRGATLKKLERDTGCKIMIRGRGSIRKDKEADVRGKPGWEHVFNENLHVVIEVSDAPDEHYAQLAVTRAKEAVELLLVPVPEEKDSLKRQQLRELAILNGTFRASDSHLNVVPSAASHQMHLAPTSTSTPHHQAAHPMDSRTASVAVAAAAAAAHASQVSSMSNSHGLLNGSQQYGTPRSPATHLLPFQPTSPGLRSLHRGASAAGVGGVGTTGSGTYREIGVSGNTVRIPSLDIEAMSESCLASPSGALGGGIPAPSPTIVDPEMYPFPPTPSLPSGDGSSSATTYGSPIWSPMHTAPAAPPPMPAPLHQSNHGYSAPSQHQTHQQHYQQYQYQRGLQQQPPRSPQAPQHRPPQPSPPPPPQQQLQEQHFLFSPASQSQHHERVGSTGVHQHMSLFERQYPYPAGNGDGLGPRHSPGLRAVAHQDAENEQMYCTGNPSLGTDADRSDMGMPSLSPSAAVVAAVAAGSSSSRPELDPVSGDTLTQRASRNSVEETRQAGMSSAALELKALSFRNPEALGHAEASTQTESADDY